jgi:hypothetical protein
MVQNFNITPTDPLALSDFFAAAEAVDAPEFSAAHIEQCATLLARLSASDLLWTHLASHGSPEEWLSSFAGPQSITLGSSKNFALRANIWLPVKASNFEAHERELYAYHQLAHSHNFRFLTVGHFGPGYESDCFEIDTTKVEGRPGERVELFNFRREQLTPGRVMYFHPYSDVHIQREPEELSISINLLFRNEPRLRDQLFVDVDSSTIMAAPFDTLSNRRAGVMRIASLFGNPDTIKLLESVKASHEHPGLRDNARLALADAQAAATPGAWR